MEKERKKLGLALGGGGARGFCHIGVLQVFEENNIPIDVVTGCSMGSIVGGCYACGMNPSDMEVIAAKFKQSIITDFDPLLRNQGFFKGNRSINFIKKHIGDKDFEDCLIPFAATTVDAKQGELIVITEGKIIEAMRASFSIPVAFQHTTACGRGCLVDGGIIERIPINSAKKLGADIVIAVDAIGEPEPVENIKGILEMINRVYFLVDWQGWQHKQKDADLIITPSQPGKMVHDFKNNIKSIEAGREAAEKLLPQIKELVAAL